MSRKRGVLDAPLLSVSDVVDEYPATCSVSIMRSVRCKSTRVRHTCNSFLRPVLQADPIIVTIIDLLRRGAAVEQSLALPGNRLGEVTEPIPLATLLFKTYQPGLSKEREKSGNLRGLKV